MSQPKQIKAAARAIRDEFGPGKDGGTRDDDEFYERLARAALTAADKASIPYQPQGRYVSPDCL